MMKPNIAPATLRARRKYLARTGNVTKREGADMVRKLPPKNSTAV